jgi:hypothetical protein
MPVTTAEARGRIIESLGTATDRLAEASECVMAAHEALDDATAERLEGDLFRPLQKSFGRLKRERSRFSARSGIPAREAGSAPAPSAREPKALIEQASAAVEAADHELAELQDSMLPVEAGDPELRAGIADVREHTAPLPGRARGLVRTLGR